MECAYSALKLPVMNGMVLMSMPSQLSAGSHLVTELVSKLMVVVALSRGSSAGSMPYLSGFCRVVGKISMSRAVQYIHLFDILPSPLLVDARVLAML